MEKKSFFAVAVVLLIVFLGVLNSAASQAEEVIWSDELVVFGPLHRDHPAPDSEILSAVPDSLEIEGNDRLPPLSLTPNRLDWEPGEAVDLEKFTGEERADHASPESRRGAAYVFAELYSPKQQSVTFGLGADWWMECRINGQPFFDTLERGNVKTPISILNHQAEVELNEGKNILAVRLIRGRSSAMLALGDESMFAAKRRQRAERAGLNTLPENFSDRLIFPERKQAIISSGWDIDLSLPNADLADGALVGLETMPDRQIYLDKQRGETRDTLNRHFNDPVKIRLSKDRYPYEDRHLDAIVWTSPADPEADPTGRIQVLLKSADGETLARHVIDELSRNGLFFSVGFPPRIEGSDAELEVIWRAGDEDVDVEVGRSSAKFRVESASGVKTSGRVPLEVINAPGAVISGAPMTTGVPFPRGALEDESNVRLVDEHGKVVALQTKITARWSRFGTIKWLLCDFTADLDGGPRRFYLEYGPDIERSSREAIEVSDRDAGFPPLDAGRIRVTEQSIELDARGDGTFADVLDAGALSGAFVKHEDGRVYTMPEDAGYAVEEIGSEKAVVRRSGWYRHAGSGEEFCNYVTRFVFHRDSPVVRLFHTWIFTGDGNRDRIADMGWRFTASGGFEPDGLLSSFNDGVWHESQNLVQFDYKQYDLLGGVERGRRDGRAPGVMSGRSGGARVTFGVKDFWQSFPSELEVTESGLTFFNWPRNNPRATFERPVARGDAFRNRFVHEGELLDFRLPEEYVDVEGEIWERATRGGHLRELHFAQGRPETANAQGIARTEEMFLYLTADSVEPDAAAKVMRGLNDETLRAVVDPVWMTGSGVFDEGDVPVHPRDVENFPEVERIYELTMEAPRRWVERLGVYGMWLHGDYPTWNINLDNRTVSPYRTFRGNHHAYPLRWIPFIRSGDPQFLKLAENATRRLVDANFCHYASEDIDRAVGPLHFRRQGRWDRSLLPWTGRLGPHLRTYTVDTGYMWDTYYMTGYGRARDVALLFGELTRYDHEAISVGARGSREKQSIKTSYMDMYRATFNPWFLESAHVLADLCLEAWGDREEVEQLTFSTGWAGNIWRVSYPRFYAFTGREDFRHQARNNVVAWASPYIANMSAAYRGDGGAHVRASAHAWSLTGDPFYLHRLAAGLESVRIRGYEGDIDYKLGLPTGGHGGAPAGNALSLPMAMAVLSAVDLDLDPIHDPAVISGEFIGEAPDSRQRVSGADLPGEYHFSYPDVFIRREEAGAFELIFDLIRRGGREGEDSFAYRPYKYEIEGPEGTHFSQEGDAPEKVRLSGPEGIYRVNRFTRVPADREDLMRRHHRDIGKVVIPVAYPETPEVVKFEHTERGTSVPAGSQGYWFYVPEDVGEFWIDFSESVRSSRVSVWNPDGERAWDRSYSRDTGLERVSINVPSEQRGKLWKATGASFRIDPQIPPYFSLRRRKWFNPEK